MRGPYTVGWESKRLLGGRDWSTVCNQMVVGPATPHLEVWMLLHMQKRVSKDFLRCWARLKVLLSCPEQHLIQEDPDLIEKRVRWSLFESISFSRGLMVYDSLLPVLFFLLSSSDSRGGWSLHIRFERHLIWAQKTNYSLFSVHEQTILVRRLMFIGLAAAVSF